MYYYNNTSKAFPDLNYFSSPYQVLHPLPVKNEIIKRDSQNEMNEEIDNTRFNFYSQLGINQRVNDTIKEKNDFQSIQLPRQVKIVVLYREEENVDNNLENELTISNSNSIQLDFNENKYDNLEKLSSETQTSETHSETDQSQHTQMNLNTPPKFSVSKFCFSNEILTEFNNFSKLKKINSSYHIKRKISTKLQNDIKSYVNNLISSINQELKCSLPLVTCNSKEFRENVKNEFVRSYGDQPISKYISEDVIVVRKNPTKAGRVTNNKFLLQKIENLLESKDKSCKNLKILVSFLNNTLVKDFYAEFLNSPRYSKCLEKDLEKYAKKISSKSINLNFSEEKKSIFTQIYRTKYDGVAKSFFS